MHWGKTKGSLNFARNFLAEFPSDIFSGIIKHMLLLLFNMVEWKLVENKKWVKIDKNFLSKLQQMLLRKSPSSTFR